MPARLLVGWAAGHAGLYLRELRSSCQDKLAVATARDESGVAFFLKQVRPGSSGSVRERGS